MKPVGTWEVTRRIKLPALGHAAAAMAVERALESLIGVRKVRADVEKKQVRVRYDATGSNYQAIVRVLENTGFPPLDNWWSRLKAGWFQYPDTNSRDNAEAPSPPCCNKPPH